MKVTGAELRVGDVIELWYARRVTITALRPYTGPLAGLFAPAGAQLAECALHSPATGITIDNAEVYEVFNRTEGA